VPWFAIAAPLIKCRDHLSAVPTKDMSDGNVRFGSKADMCSAQADVRFASKSGHPAGK
jgi:hypothetical protein